MDMLMETMFGSCLSHLSWCRCFNLSTHPDANPLKSFIFTIGNNYRGAMVGRVPGTLYLTLYLIIMQK